jgi:hypothetical protein
VGGAGVLSTDPTVDLFAFMVRSLPCGHRRAVGVLKAVWGARAGDKIMLI